MYCCGFESVTFVRMSTTSQVLVPETDAKPIEDEFEFRLRRPALEYFPAECQISGADASTDDQKKKIIQERLTEGDQIRDQSDCQTRASEDDDQKGHDQAEKRIEEEEEEEDEDDDASVEKLEISKAGLFDQVDGDHHKEEQELEEEEEINDGFRTPTSLETKIPAIQRCPPAPRKPRSEPSMKRSRSCYSTTSCRVRIHVSDDLLESLFQPLVSDVIGPGNKKARKIK